MWTWGSVCSGTPPARIIGAVANNPHAFNQCNIISCWYFWCAHYVIVFARCCIWKTSVFGLIVLKVSFLNSVYCFKSGLHGCEGLGMFVSSPALAENDLGLQVMQTDKQKEWSIFWLQASLLSDAGVSIQVHVSLTPPHLLLIYISIKQGWVWRAVWSVDLLAAWNADETHWEV